MFDLLISDRSILFDFTMGTWLFSMNGFAYFRNYNFGKFQVKWFDSAVAVDFFFLSLSFATDSCRQTLELEWKMKAMFVCVFKISLMLQFELVKK